MNREPSYQGRTLAQWLEDYNRAWSSGSDSKAQVLKVGSTNAIRHMGTNAIPFLLKKLSAKQNVFEERLKPVLEKIHFRDHDQERYLGLGGFMILGKDATSAVPALINLTSDPRSEVRYCALRSIRCIAPDQGIILPVLLKTLHDSDRTIRSESVLIFSDCYPEEAKKAGVYVEFPVSLPRGTNQAPPSSSEGNQ